MTQANRRPRILHLHSTFDAGGKELRCARLINSLSDADHAIVSGDPGKRGAAAVLDPKAKVSWPKFPSLAGSPLPGRLKQLAAAMQGYDLICTYNWGAMDAAMAHTLFADFYRLAPLVHHEDGFNEDESARLKLSRNLYRRVALGRSAALVVPSKRLEEIALNIWNQTRSKVRRIPNGIDTRAYAKRTRRDVLQGLIKHKGERWVGTLAGLRKVKDLPALVRACSELPSEWHLVIAGEGPERDAILAEAERCGTEDRVHLPGHVAHPEKLVPLFDIFALSSRSEQFPISVVEAMAAGLPVVAPDVGDVADMVSEANRDLIVPPGNEKALADALSEMALYADRREAIGAANRDRVRKSFDEETMIKRYRSLYWGLMGLTGTGGQRS